MSVARKSAVFLVITFAISWTIAVLAWRGGMTNLEAATRPVYFQLFPFGPAIAALICTLAFERRAEWLKALGLGFRPNIWWLIALFPLVLGLIAAAFNIVAAGHDLLMPQSWKDAATGLADNAMGRNFPNLWTGFLVASLIALLTEEPGWRGYLYHLWRGWGYWRFSIVVGLIWAAWHLPMLLLFSLIDQPASLAEVASYTAGVTMLSVYATLIRDKAGSVIAVALFHGAWNSVANHGAATYYIIALMLIGVAVIAWRQRVGSGDKVAAQAAA